MPYDLDFARGDFIVQAGPKKFRVYREIVSLASPIFTDMFSIPQPTAQNGEEPDLTMPSDDDPEGVGHLLTALHDRRCVSKRFVEIVPYSRTMTAGISPPTRLSPSMPYCLFSYSPGSMRYNPYIAKHAPIYS
jgi:hypothetical protein